MVSAVLALMSFPAFAEPTLLQAGGVHDEQTVPPDSVGGTVQQLSLVSLKCVNCTDKGLSYMRRNQRVSDPHPLAPNKVRFFNQLELPPTESIEPVPGETGESYSGYSCVTCKATEGPKQVPLQGDPSEGKATKLGWVLTNPTLLATEFEKPGALEGGTFIRDSSSSR